MVHKNSATSDSVPVSPTYSNETETRSLTTITSEQLLSSDIPDVSWLVEPFIPHESVTILASPANHGKSWSLLELSIETARGGKWLGKFECDRGRVLYIDEESSLPLLKKRFSRLLAGKHLSAKNLNIHFCIGKGVSFGTDEALKGINGLIGRLKPTLVIIDSLIRVHQGDENSSADMARVFGRVRRIVRQHRCSIVFADHQRKPTQFQVSEDFLVRGSTDKVASVDSLLCLMKKDNVQFVTHAKSRFAPEFPRFVFEIVDISGEATEVRFLDMQANYVKGERTLKAKEFIEETFGEHSEAIARRDFIELALKQDIPAKQLDDALSELVASGHVDRTDLRTEEGRGGKTAHFKWIKCEQVVSELDQQNRSGS